MAMVDAYFIYSYLSKPFSAFEYIYHQVFRFLVIRYFYCFKRVSTILTYSLSSLWILTCPHKTLHFFADTLKFVIFQTVGSSSLPAPLSPDSLTNLNTETVRFFDVMLLIE